MFFCRDIIIKINIPLFLELCTMVREWRVVILRRTCFSSHMTDYSSIYGNKLPSNLSQCFPN